jgi:hypothetical protein
MGIQKPVNPIPSLHVNITLMEIVVHVVMNPLPGVSMNAKRVIQQNSQMIKPTEKHPIASAD